jgi:hypothetical protein
MPQTWNWFQALNYYLIENWEHCHAQLKNSEYDMIGLKDYMTDKINCVSGNCWWAKAKYIKQLQSPTKFFLEYNKTRMVESWISTGKPKTCYVYDIGDIHHSYFFTEKNTI